MPLLIVHDMKIHKFIFSPIDVNTYILDDEKGSCALIDCGCYSGEEFKTLTAFLKENKLKPVMLLNTHLHLDHIFGNGLVYREYGLLTHATSEEDANRRNAQKHAMMFGMSMEEPPEIGTIIKDGDVINFAGTEIFCLFVPGHTAGSIAYYIPSEGIVFTGDALFAGSIGRTDLPGGDYEMLISSINNKLLSLDQSTLIYPGHGMHSTIGAEKENNPYLN